jgi:uroporphyrin-III C-methyltransferase
VPGVSAALAGPALATIAVTQRGAAESLHVATGVARGGRAGSIPAYIRSQTLVLLMGVARLGEVVKALTGAGYPRYTPVALIERASLTDQRVLETTLESCEAAVEALGAQRPPGMLVFGWTVLALSGTGDMTVLDEGEDSEEKDLTRIARWLGEGVRWRVLEGIDDEWEGL